MCGLCVLIVGVLFKQFLSNFHTHCVNTITDIKVGPAASLQVFYSCTDTNVKEKIICTFTIISHNLFSLSLFV